MTTPPFQDSAYFIAPEEMMLIEHNISEQGAGEMDSEAVDPTPNSNGFVPAKKYVLLTNPQRKSIAEELLAKSSACSLTKVLSCKRGVLKEVANSHNVSSKTIGRIWATTKLQVQQGLPLNTDHKRTGKCGKKSVPIDIEAIRAITKSKRTTLRSLTACLNLSVSKVHNLLSDGTIRSHTNAIKPALSDKNNLERLKWSMCHIIPRTVDEPPQFSNMFNVIHVDEKWFFMSQITTLLSFSLRGRTSQKLSK
ncbi:unnamed protein product [Cuscuta epithymum]|uniref:DUF7769 domain-containing protein n=1 Tax=Cuscuta epithymum TaxID=186058 RepID=A0AAV0CZS4_9ASTE|nr:unnamed protein product [Cuscuta epithymum]